MPDQEAPLKDATIKVLKIKEDKWNDKPYWKIIDQNGDEWSLWNKMLRDHIKEGESYPIKYSEKQTDRGIFKSIQQIVGVDTRQKGGFGRGGLSFEEQWKLSVLTCKTGIMKSCIEAGVPNLFAEAWAKVIGEAPQNQATKPLETKHPEDRNQVYILGVKPSLAIPDKPAEVPPAQGAKGSLELWNAINTANATLKWGTARIKQEALKLANANKWENGELIAQNGIKVLDDLQLAHLVALMQTEVGKQSAK